MSKDKITILSEIFEIEQTGEKVEGVTVMIDGKLKEMFDIVIKKENLDANYIELVQKFLFDGINNYIKTGKY